MEKIEVKDEADCDIKLETKEEDDLNESKHSKNHTVLKNTRIKEEVVDLVQFEISEVSRKHVKRHKGRLKCHICGRTFREVRTLNLHLPMHDEGKRYKCNICQREFKRAQDMRRHKESHRSEAHFNCQQCWRSFKGEYQLQVHVRNVHSGECSCPICGEVVSSKYALRCHRSLHKKSKEKIVGSSKTNTGDAGGSLTTIIVKTEYEVTSFD
ncbi:hypothetical protein DMENIID0001_132220 [Sergentomyia squamirostris]